jgi:hypothetical protein
LATSLYLQMMQGMGNPRAIQELNLIRIDRAKLSVQD